MSIVLILGPFAAGLSVHAQEETEDDAETAQLKKDKLRAETLKAIIEAEQAQNAARFPKPTSSPLAGTTTTNDAEFIEERILGHRAVSKAADVVADEIYRQFGSMQALVVHTIDAPTSMNLMAAYAAGVKRIDALKLRFSAVALQEQNALNSVPVRRIPSSRSRQGGGTDRVNLVGGIGAATSVVGSFVDFLSFFRTNVDIRGTTFDVTEDIFVSALFRALKTKYHGNINLYYPNAVPPNIDSIADSPMLRKIEELYIERDRAEDLKRQIDERVAQKRKQIDDLTKLIGDAQRVIDRAATDAGFLESKIGEYEQAIAELEEDIVKLNRGAQFLPGVNKQFENLIKDLLAVDEKSGLSLVTGYILTEGLQAAMEGANSYWLTLDVIKAGGNRKVKTNLIWDVFRGGAKVSHSGGAVVHYNIYNKKGVSLLSGISDNYQKYITADKIK